MTLSGILIQSVCGRDSKPRETREALQRRSLDPELPWPRAPANVQAEQGSAHSRYDQTERGPPRVQCETTANQRQTLKCRASQGKAMSKDAIHNPGLFFFFFGHMASMTSLSQPGWNLSEMRRSLSRRTARDIPTTPFRTDFSTVGTEAGGIPSKW